MNIEKHPCPSCKGERNCTALFEYKDTTGGLLFSSIGYYVLQCAGCGTIFFLIRRQFNGDDSTKIDEYFPRISQIESDVILQLSFNNDVKHIVSLYSEVESAINHGLMQLAAAGIRTLIDRICFAKTSSRGNFTQNLKSLRDAKYISVPQYEQLKIIIDVGSSAVHRLTTPKGADILACFAVVESVVKTLFIHPSLLEKVKNNTPERS